ncbi:MAG: DUF493 domain-containing protein [Acidiferrobacteraceae bacterium]|jgi:hypothetical protein|nr:DUF493 domain-containing protein [Acidiferrobacteraceae bacterium]MDP6123326.1 DUF493 domain-containing protein [Arenicellales bacterium]MDP6434054.1 DUF493 domain-containing protein [Arenicellales bacterium]MDP6672938.1 DUF493 domain-containing protein [Arenicellales bacterium]MDP6724855.1 DUF493 domain-containing protein [Arenicellales bacterium]|tara:strand:- start:14161 stop:14448 length:288 start_codon:yes stop_codon:yes gene_type:complete
MSGSNGGNGEASSPIEFPCDFDIKVMGENSKEFEARVVAVITLHIAPDALLSIRSRPSRNGRYLSITVTIRAESRLQVDSIYLDLHQTKSVVMTL